MVTTASLKFSTSLDSDHELKNDENDEESSIFSDVKYYRRDSHSDASDR